MKNRLNLLFNLCLGISLIILVLPAKLKVAYYSPSVLGYFYLFTLVTSILLFIYLSYNDFKNKNKKSFFNRLLVFIGFVIIFIVLWLYLSKHTGS